VESMDHGELLGMGSSRRRKDRLHKIDKFCTDNTKLSKFYIDYTKLSKFCTDQMNFSVLKLIRLSKHL